MFPTYFQKEFEIVSRWVFNLINRFTFFWRPLILNGNNTFSICDHYVLVDIFGSSSFIPSSHARVRRYQTVNLIFSFTFPSRSLFMNMQSHLGVFLFMFIDLLLEEHRMRFSHILSSHPWNRWKRDAIGLAVFSVSYIAWLLHLQMIGMEVSFLLWTFSYVQLPYRFLTLLSPPMRVLMFVVCLGVVALFYFLLAKFNTAYWKQISLEKHKQM